VARFQLRVSALERENKAAEVRCAGEAEDKVRASEQAHEHEQRKLNQRVWELEKRLEVLKVNSDERLNLALDQKDKEIAKLQEKLQVQLLEHQNAIMQFDAKVQDLQCEIHQRDK
jgi:hypothetical protein